MPLGDRAVIVTGDAFHQAATALKRRWRAGLFSALILVAACSGSPGDESPREAEVESPTEVTTVEDTVPLLDAIEIRGGQCSAPADELSVARVWNETVLAAIRRDFPAPTVHSRNLFHLSVAMWNVWAALDADGTQLLIDAPAFVAGDESDAIDAARVDATSFAAHRLLTHRYANAEGASRSLESFDALLQDWCGAIEPIDSTTASAAGYGVAMAESIITATIDDGSLERASYEDAAYAPVNRPLVLDEDVPDPEATDLNRWQPLVLEIAVAQNGLPIDGGAQVYVGSNWGDVTPFALSATNGGLPLDPGPPPLHGTESQAEYMAGVEIVLDLSSRLATGHATIDLSPSARGANPLGTNDGGGHAANPATGEAYPANVVDEADFFRVIAEYWADGPDSETPPGHWNVLANEVTDQLDASELRIGGAGPAVERLEWDVKLYLGLNGALHDAAIAAWGAKAHFDYTRPITMIRTLGALGLVESDSDQAGLPSIPGLIELVTADSSAVGERHENLAFMVGEVAVLAWQGPPASDDFDVAGVGWVPAERWVPYQRSTFVTPAFAAYVSGHSTFSRAGAEVLTAMTGTSYFPGGLATRTVERGDLLHEDGPSAAVTLQWATYFDAADEAGFSRLPGGIHVPVDDFAGRLMGAEAGTKAWALASELFGR
ncbi:MAG: hypothetical protein ACI91O_000993 [Candidatus Poriferisodalaceae bacterium]|jgi:hypothetical protein